MVSTSEVTQTDAGEARLVRTWKPSSDPWAAVLIVHGLGEHSGRYEHVGAHMAEAGLEVRSFDLPGFGRSGGRRGHVTDLVHYLNAVEEELAELSGAGLRTVLLGHSLGGLIAYRYAHSDRPQPDLLVLSAPSLAANVPGWQRALAPLLARVAPKLSLPNPVKGEQLSRDPAVGEAYFADPLVYTSSSVALGAAAFRAMDESEMAAAPPMPCLVIHGGADTLVPAAGSVRLGEQPGVERTLYPSLRHECFNEPEGPDVIADVINWIRGQLG